MWIADEGRIARPSPSGPAARRPLAGITALIERRSRAIGRDQAQPPPSPIPHARLSLRPSLLLGRAAGWSSLGRSIQLAITVTTVITAGVARPTPAQAERTAAVEVAMVTDLAGRVERQPQAITHWAAVALDEGIALFDAMRTWERSTAELRFVDGTVVMLDEKTRLRISPVLFDPAQAPEEVRLALAEGSAEVRAGTARLWVDTPDGMQHAVAPGEAVRISVGDDPHLPRVGPPTGPMPADLERGPMPAPSAGAGPGAGAGAGGGSAFDPTTGRVDPTAPVEGLVEGLPGTIGVEIDPSPDGAVIQLPPIGDGPDPEMPDPELPIDPPVVPQLPDLVPGAVILGDLLPDGILPVLDLPDVPTEGRVRVSVEVRRR